MNDSKNIYFYLTAVLAFLIPVPGRFVFAFYLLILFDFQILFLTLIFHGIDKLKLGGLKEPILIFSLIFLSVLYKQLLYIFCPIAAITLGFCIYLPSLSTFTISFFFGRRDRTFSTHLAENMKACGVNSLICAVLYIFRDLIGYGTLTLPAFKKIVYLTLPFSADKVYAGAFFATIPGGLVLCSVILALYIFVTKKFDIIAHTGKY